MESLSERTSTGYQQIHDGIIHLVDSARTETVRSVNALMTATYWEIGRRIVEFEQGGEARAAYGAQLIKRLSKDLSLRYKRGFSAKNLRQMRLFYLFFQHVEIRQTMSGELTPLGIPQTPSAEFPSAKIWQTLSAISPLCHTQSPFAGTQCDKSVAIFAKVFALSRNVIHLVKKGTFFLLPFGRMGSRLVKTPVSGTACLEALFFSQKRIHPRSHSRL